MSLAYAMNEKEFRAMLSLLSDKNYISLSLTSELAEHGQATLNILADGWEFVHASSTTDSYSYQGFIAAWFDLSTNEFIDAISSVIKETRFKPVCIRDEKFPERIMDKALGEIRKSRFIVVDLTGTRSSVFFEAGFAEALGLEVFYLHKGKIPSDSYIRHYQCYTYNSVDELKEVLRDALSARLNAPRK
jgi:hypothetical protein